MKTGELAATVLSVLWGLAAGAHAPDAKPASESSQVLGAGAGEGGETESAVRGVVARYLEACSKGDLEAVARVYPTLSAENRTRLRRVLGQYTTYSMEIGALRIDFEEAAGGMRASAIGSILHSMKARAGHSHSAEVLADFRLVQKGGLWQIVAIHYPRDAAAPPSSAAPATRD